MVVYLVLPLSGSDEPIHHMVMIMRMRWSTETSMTDEMSLKLTSSYPPSIDVFTNIYYYIWKPKIHMQNLDILSEFIITLASLFACL